MSNNSSELEELKRRMWEQVKQYDLKGWQKIHQEIVEKYPFIRTEYFDQATKAMFQDRYADAVAALEKHLEYHPFDLHAGMNKDMVYASLEENVAKRLGIGMDELSGDIDVFYLEDVERKSLDDEVKKELNLAHSRLCEYDRQRGARHHSSNLSANSINLGVL